MTSTLGNLSMPRTLVALAATVTVAVGAGAAFVRALHAPSGAGPGFESLLHLGALAALSGCAGCFAMTLAVLVWEHRHGPGPLGRLCPRSCRRWLVALCSAGVAVGVVAPCSAAPADTGGHQAAAGLPSLDRPLSGVRTAGHIVVRPGDSLWSLVRARHPGEGPGAIARRVRALYLANATLIGDDPDVICPGQVLRVPDERGHLR